MSTTTNKLTSAKELMKISAQVGKKYFEIPSGKNLSIAINPIAGDEVLPRMVTYKCKDGSLCRINVALKVKNTANGSKTNSLHLGKVQIALLLKEIDAAGGAQDVKALREAIVSRATTILAKWATSGGQIGLSEVVSEEEGKKYYAALYVGGNDNVDIKSLQDYNVNSSLDIATYSNENMVSLDLDFNTLLGGETIIDQDLLAWWDKSCISDSVLAESAGMRALA